MPFAMKRAVRASRRYVNTASPRGDTRNYTLERHPSLLHLTANEISQISTCQMSVDKRWLTMSVKANPIGYAFTNAKLIKFL